MQEHSRAIHKSVVGGLTPSRPTTLWPRSSKVEHSTYTGDVGMAGFPVATILVLDSTMGFK